MVDIVVGIYYNDSSIEKGTVGRDHWQSGMPNPLI